MRCSPGTSPIPSRSSPPSSARSAPTSPPRTPRSASWTSEAVPASPASRSPSPDPRGKSRSWTPYRSEPHFSTPPPPSAARRTYGPSGPERRTPGRWAVNTGRRTTSSPRGPSRNFGSSRSCACRW